LIVSLPEANRQSQGAKRQSGRFISLAGKQEALFIVIARRRFVTR
jgi:hypothetical protein